MFGGPCLPAALRWRLQLSAGSLSAVALGNGVRGELCHPAKNPPLNSLLGNYRARGQKKAWAEHDHSACVFFFRGFKMNQHLQAFVSLLSFSLSPRSPTNVQLSRHWGSQEWYFLHHQPEANVSCCLCPLLVVHFTKVKSEGEPVRMHRLSRSCTKQSLRITTAVRTRRWPRCA